MKDNKILVLGYFGYGTNQLDGQTVKTRSIYELFSLKQEQENIDLKSFDTQSFQKNKLNVFKMFSAIIQSNTLIYIAAHNNLKYFFPLIFILSKIFKVKIHYILVGGWLADFIENKPIHIKMLRNINGIYPQTIDLTNRLINEYSFCNVYQLHNFRIISSSNICKSEVYIDTNNIRLVFMARVHPMKGVGTIFALADRLNEEKKDNVSIDLYGPIFDEYKDEFEKQLKGYNNVSYKGILEPDIIHETLTDYDIMLFPTRYFTEGFPGSILDAYMAGIPVIATKWKYADEFIADHVSGVISPFEDDEGFIDNVLSMINDTAKINKLKEGAQKQAMKYRPEVAWKVIEKTVF